MIRSRDLVVFVVVILCLLLAIAVTLFAKSKSVPLLSDGLVFFDLSKDASSTFTAEKTEGDSNTENTITRLRTLLMQSDTVVVPTPEVEPISISESDVVTPDESTVSQVVINSCEGVDYAASVLPSWPQNEIKMLVENGTRSFVHVTKKAIPTASLDSASSSAPLMYEFSTTTLLQMRAYPVVMSNTSCVGSEVIGVTSQGGLLRNQSALLYKGYGPDDLVGYARDGFPIYGLYDGVVDECGGYQNIQGYRYSLGATRDFVLGCYAGVPSPFLNQ